MMFIKSPATSSALPNHYDADVALQESTDDTASTVEEYSIVEAGGNVPQVLIHLKAPFESCLQPSLSVSSYFITKGHLLMNRFDL